MAIKRFSNYETTRSYSDYPQLPTGGYILRIMGAEVKQNSVGQYVQIGCDIAEGEYKDFFAKEYRNQNGEDKKWHCNYLLNVPNDDGTEKDGWTARRFKTVIEALESSNPGYHFDWDETKFKNKLIGGLFNLREYVGRDGKVHTAVNLAQLTDVQRIRDGKFTIPENKTINQTSGNRGTQSSTGFMSIPDGVEEELPFN